MSAADLAAVLASMVALATVAVLVLLLVRVRRITDELRGLVTEVRSTLEGSVTRVDGMVEDIDSELKRVGGLVDAAEAVSARADTLSRLTYGAVARPVIKTVAVVKGTGRAARMLRRGGDRLDERAG